MTSPAEKPLSQRLRELWRNEVVISYDGLQEFAKNLKELAEMDDGPEDIEGETPK